MTKNIYEFKVNNKTQVLEEAELIRNNVQIFNEKNKEYKIEKIVLGSSKIYGLFNGEDTIYLSIKDLNNKSFKDVGYSSFDKGCSQLEIDLSTQEKIRAQIKDVMNAISHLLEDLKGSKILKFESVFELEISKNFKGKYTKEIFDRKSYKNKGVSLNRSILKEKDFFLSQSLNYKLEQINKRIAESDSLEKPISDIKFKLK